MLLENDIEKYVKETLEARGFKVLKLTTPGTTGVMDRMILRPRYWPGPPMFLELKREKKTLRAKQIFIEKDWKLRGCNVLPPVHGIDEAKQIVGQLIALSYDAYMLALPDQVYDPPAPTD